MKSLTIRIVIMRRKYASFSLLHSYLFQVQRLCFVYILVKIELENYISSNFICEGIVWIDLISEQNSMDVHPLDRHDVLRYEGRKVRFYLVFQLDVIHYDVCLNALNNMYSL